MIEALTCIITELATKITAVAACTLAAGASFGTRVCMAMTLRNAHTIGIGQLVCPLGTYTVITIRDAVEYVTRVCR